jgi:hypothetical protein
MVPWALAVSMFLRERDCTRDHVLYGQISPVLACNGAKADGLAEWIVPPLARIVRFGVAFGIDEVVQVAIHTTPTDFSELGRDISPDAYAFIRTVGTGI